MRKGRFFRRNPRFYTGLDRLHDGNSPLDALQDRLGDSLERLQRHTREHPTSTLLLAGAAGIATGLLLWTAFRRRSSSSHHSDTLHW